jgi:hypothetical protein
LVVVKAAKALVEGTLMGLIGRRHLFLSVALEFAGRVKIRFGHFHGDRPLWLERSGMTCARCQAEAISVGLNDEKR